MKYWRRQVLLLVYCCMIVGAAAQVNSGIKDKDAHALTPDSSLVMIADIAVKGNKKTKSYIIEREVPFRQGDYILRSELNKKIELAREQVMNTSLFVDVNVYIDSTQGELVFINVDVKERWYLFPLPYFKIVDRNFNQWWVENKRSFDRVNYGIKFMQNNVSGRNDELNIWLVSGYNRQVMLRYEQPFADKKLKSGFDVGFSYSRQHELNYRSDINKQVFFKQDNFVRQYMKAEVSYLYRPAIKTRHSFKIAYIDDQIVDTIYKLNPIFFPNHLQRVRYPELSYSLQYFNVDYIPYPAKGFMGDVTLTKRGFNKDMNLWQLQVHGSYTIPVFKKNQVQLQAGGVIRLPFNQPFYNQQLFGYGDIFMRGLEYYVIDGVAGAVGRVTARNEIYSFSFKNPVKTQTHDQIPFRFYLKAFADGGYAYNKSPGSSILNNRVLKTWGFGLDVVTIYDVVFKIEYSLNQLGGQGLFIHTRSDF